MAGNKYLSHSGGNLQEVAAIQTSAGASDAGKIPALDASGLLASSMMPAGVGADTIVVPASEAIADGDFVNLYNDDTTVKCRKADATTNKPAHGFVLAAVESAANATIYPIGTTNSHRTGMTVGTVQYLATTPGATTETAPSATGNIVQRLGVSSSATAINFNPSDPIILA
jgi:hypothetical protein